MKKLAVFTFLFVAFPIISYSAPAQAPVSAPAPEISIVDHTPYPTKAQQPRYRIGLYRPTYVLPIYYTETPANKIYQNDTPDNQKIRNADLKYQISLAVPVWENMFEKKANMYVAYTQLSYWQSYAHSPYFRETNYEPEVFVRNRINGGVLKKYYLKFYDIGLNHQSNGRGGEQERSWNRIYGDFVLGNKFWFASVKPWFILPDKMLNQNNGDIRHFLGNGQVTLSHRMGEQVFSAMFRNALESGFQRGAVQLTWSISVSKNIRFYTQAFSGYGQSLIEYNHYTNGIGIGFSLNDWL